MAKSFDELADRVMTPSLRLKARERTQEIMAEMLLSELRKMTGHSQADLARALNVKQPGIARIEKQEDMQISTLHRIVEALGGQLDIIAHLPQMDVKITQFNRSVKAENVPDKKSSCRST